jgi:hypothetical protein
VDNGFPPPTSSFVPPFSGLPPIPPGCNSAIRLPFPASAGFSASAIAVRARVSFADLTSRFIREQRLSFERQRNSSKIVFFHRLRSKESYTATMNTAVASGLLLAVGVGAVNNGLARTPQMGWVSFDIMQRFNLLDQY